MASVISASTTSTTALTLSGDTTGILELKTGSVPTTAMTISSSGNIRFGVAATNNGIVDINTGTGTYIIDWVAASGARGFAVDSSGQVITVDGTASSPVISFRDDLNTGIFRATTDTLGFSTGGLERMRINSSGNVGIGTSSIGARLDIVGTTGTMRITSSTGTNGVNLRVNNTGGDFYFGRENSTGGAFGVTAYSSLLWSEGAYPMVFATNNAERMRITAGGSVGIGTNNPGGFFEVKGGNGNQVNLNNGGEQFTQVNWLNNGNVKAYQWYDNTNDRMQFQTGASGGVYLANGGTSWTSASDERLKDIIEPITNATQKISRLRAVIGKYKTDEKNIRRSFLIAQDVQAVLPEAVNQSNDEIGTLGLSYTETIPLLVAAIKEQQAMIEELTNRIKKLEGV